MEGSLGVLVWFGLSVRLRRGGSPSLVEETGALDVSRLLVCKKRRERQRRQQDIGESSKVGAAESWEVESCPPW